MNDRSHNESLLNDILAEDAPAGLREALLDDTLRQVRRRRHLRRARRAGLVLAVATGLSLVVWHRPTPTSLPPEPAKAYVLVRTQPLPPEAWLETRPFSPPNLIVSNSTANLVTTAEAGYHFRNIDDEELLDLVAPNPAVLIRQAPHEAELVLANPLEPGGRLGN